MRPSPFSPAIPSNPADPTLVCEADVVTTDQLVSQSAVTELESMGLTRVQIRDRLQLVALEPDQKRLLETLTSH